MNLTPKQEAFCQAIVAGNNQSDAFHALIEVARMGLMQAGVAA